MNGHGKLMSVARVVAWCDPGVFPLLNWPILWESDAWVEDAELTLLVLGFAKGVTA